jgi:hypothetical protein
MNQALSELAARIGLAQASRESLRLAFCLACAGRVERLLEDPRAVDCLAVLRRFVAGEADAADLRAAAGKIAAVANSHRGSKSMDGSGHAAVSATYAVANALAGRALEAADYAAYAVVYDYGAYAVADPSAFEAEFEWQVAALERLSARAASR